ncbi:MAG TPA: glycosyltransferase family 39 protein [Spirochaetia bacterium]|nr:glycosyltransferase family 39 protein [Spirochaetia bacterium]
MRHFSSKTITRIVIGIIFVALFFYLFRLQDTQLFINDTARDTLRALRIWQGRELTLIGGSASFSEKTIKEIYFGSLYLYTAIAGMSVSSFSPVGAVLPNTLLYLLSIPVFFLLAKRHSKNKFFTLFATAVFALSPVSVTHARFFWNPNLLIPLSVFFWYLALTPSNSKHFSLKLLSSGVLAGIMFNFHYFSVISVVLFCLYLLFSKKFDHLIYLVFGFFLGSLPLILFELRNNFYLTNAFIYNTSHSLKNLSHEPTFYVDSFFRIFFSVFGLSHGEISFNTIVINQSFKLFLEIVFSILIIKYLFNKRRHSDLYWLWFCLFPTIIFTLYFSTYDLYLRYLFVVFPLLVLFIADVLSELKYFYLSLVLFIPIIFSNLSIITASVNLNNNYLPLKTIEAISKKIVEDNPSGKYNITENLKGDARSTAFRFFLLRDANVKPQDEINYGDISALYVVSPSLEKTYQDNRWEFTASGPKMLTQTIDFGEVKLFKFVSETK